MKQIQSNGALSIRRGLLHLTGAFILASALSACDSNDSDNTYTNSNASRDNGGYGGGSSSEASSSTSSDAPEKATFETADGINGGRLFSKFWADETGFSLTNSNLQTQEELDTISGFGDFFRCKQCHGWDRLGRDGGYSNRAPSATRPNVAPVDLATKSEMYTPDDLFEAIKTGSVPRRELTADLASYDPADDVVDGNRMPNFGAILTDEQIWDIVKFLKEEALDTTQLYDINLGAGEYPNRDRSFSNIGKGGDANRGDDIYAATCAVCHGDDGTLIPVDGDYTVGGHVRAKPYEDQHKVKFGHLGSPMIAGLVLNDADEEDVQHLFQALMDPVQYPDEAPVVSTIDGAALFVARCGACHNGNGMGSGGLNITGASAAGIQGAISNVAAMAGLSNLTDEEIQAIADAL